MPWGSIGILKGTFRPDVHFHCDVDFDPFLYMEDNKKVYGTYLHLAPYLSQPTLVSLPSLYYHDVRVQVHHRNIVANHERYFFPPLYLGQMPTGYWNQTF